VAKHSGLFSAGFVLINFQFALVTAIAALFFSFAGYLQLLGINPAMAGFIISADALAALIVQPLITPLIHPGTVRRWLLGGSLTLSAALWMVAHVTTAPLLIMARLLQGSGFICVLASLITMLVPFIPPGMSGRAFGYVSLIRLIPYAVIPLLFTRFSLTPASFAPLLDLASLVALLPLLGLLLPLAQDAEQPENSRPPGLSGLTASLRSPPVTLMLLSALLFFCGYSTIFFYLKQFASGEGIGNAGLFFTIATLAMIAVRLLGGTLFDRYNKGMLCGGGLVGVAACYALLPCCSSSGLFFLLALCSGLGWGIAMPLQSAAMFDLSAPATRAMNQNLLLVMMQGGFFLGPFLGGQLISRFGYDTLFIVLAVITLAAAVLMLRIAPLCRHD